MEFSGKELSILLSAMSEALNNSAELRDPSTLQARIGAPRDEAERVMERVRDARRPTPVEGRGPAGTEVSGQDARVMFNCLDFVLNESSFVQNEDFHTLTGHHREEAELVLARLRRLLGIDATAEWPA